MFLFGEDLVTFTTPTLLGIAAMLSAIVGVVTILLAIRKSRTEESEELIQNLAESRATQEQMAKQLHEIKMKHPELLDEFEIIEPPKEPEPGPDED